MNGRPYRVTTWHGGYETLGTFRTFDGAIAAYRIVNDRTKQLINDDRAECGRDGLTDDERDQVAAVAYAEELTARGVKVKDGDAFARSDAALHAHDAAMARRAAS